MPASTRLVRSLAAVAALALGSACGDTTFADADGETGGEQLGGPARGISITHVEANQGTAVFLTEGEDYVPSDQRNAYLVSERDTLVRFQHTIDDPEAWIARELTGILHIYPPDYQPDQGQELTRTREFFVEADSDPRDLNTNFYFSVVASEAVPGTRFWLELRESDPDLDVSGLGEGLAAAPVEAEAFGFETAVQQMRVTIVPVDYQYIDPPRLAAPTPEDIQLFHDDLLQQNPVQTIDIEIRPEPLVWTEQLTNLGSLLGPTRALKIEDGAPDNVYYHALVDIGGPSVNMVAGIANVTSSGKDQGDRRVAATVFYKQFDPGDEETGEEPYTYPPTGSSRTWVHELGHNQGLAHVYCPGGNAGGPDPTYPYEDGKIGVHGFGIRNFHMYTPGAAHDYMSYCGNSWVSDWTWNKTFDRIRTLTSWDFEGAAEGPATPTGPVLVGMLFADGSEDWWVYETALPQPGSGAQVLEFRAQGEVVAVELAELGLLSDGETEVVTVALPQGDGVADVDAITRVDHRGVRRELEIDRIHDGRGFALTNRVLD